MSETGFVYLVGAGPGDPGLLTARAVELIAGADTILYDRLIPEEALRHAREDAELLFVGKEAGGPSVPQEQTEAVMLERALAGRTVVRLKGGDPFVFGRGGEEAIALRGAGVPFEVVPGITAGIAAPAYAGIPVTQRGLASAVALVTGHEDPDDGEAGADWAALAAFPGTLVLYMSVRNLAQIADALIAGGRDADEPCAVVEAGTLPRQRTVAGTLATIAALTDDAVVRPPSVTVIGAVAALADRLSWLAPKPLSGRTVAVTRSRAQGGELARRLAALGARVVQAPVIATRPLPGEPLDPAPYDLVCVTSQNGVEQLFHRIAQGGRDARALAGCTVAAVGPATARALAAHGIEADIVPARAVSDALADELAKREFRRALIARPVEARDVLATSLRASGVQVDELALYETVGQPLSDRTLQAVAAADYVTFTSSSTVRHLLAAAGGAAILASTRAVSIGPVTSATLRESGVEVAVEAARHDLDGLVDAILADAGAAP
ncbi:MAG TPA: uroporphyrinogen-III C-methyltransferase [Solirubrobacteraceae bacterium]|nr:uroporphyrinogen-III C-methyltransferase [Solirubrobacteraceae bacterium]